jgi:hypothetical protein
MWSNRISGGLAGLASVLLFAGFSPARAQQPLPVSEATTVYEREVFQYSRASRPDPFRSLLLEGDIGIRMEDLGLRGVVHHDDPSRSVAVLSQRGTARRIQARIGERVGPLRVVAIYPDRVDIVVEELGVARHETLRIERTPAGGGS